VTNLNDFTNCPLLADCAGCASDRDLILAIVGTPAGVFCMTLCLRCAHSNHMPPVEARAAEALAALHCQHLGITPDEMRAEMIREALDVGR
jgi:hypothetical protein